jgi:GntR family transcriptional regulator
VHLRGAGTICRVMPAYAGTMPVDHDSPVPLYQQVADELRRRIAAEKLTRLPSLVTICQEYEVARPTAERAVKILIDAGEAYVVAGKGTYVRRPGDPR